jgi:hypothetical protein
MQNTHGKLNMGMPRQKELSTRRRLFFLDQQMEIEFKEKS